MLQADRDLGTSPDVIRAVQRLDRQSLFRVQHDTRCRTRAEHERARHPLLKRGGCWRATGVVFKKAGWLPATVLVIWHTRYDQA